MLNNMVSVKTKYWVLGALVLFGLAIFCVYQVIALQVAHSTFENYYRFRSCTELIEKTDTYGICKISSGQTIKLVNVQNRWYLDGDVGGW